MTLRRIHDNAVESLTRDELDALQLDKLKNLLSHVSKHNPFYSRMWQDAGVDVTKVKTLDDIRNLPTVEKSQFLADQIANPPYGTRLGSLISLKEPSDIYTTSGTSGQGTELHAQSLRELADMERMYSFYFAWAGMKRGDSVLLTIPITMLAGGRCEYQGAVGAGLTVLPVGNYDGAKKVEHIDRFKPTALYGGSSYFAHMATLMDGRAKDSSITTLLTGMEGVGLSFLKGIEEQWGAKAAERFGCAQMRADFMFTDEHGVGEPGKPGVLYNMDQFVLLEVLDPVTQLPVADGEFGELVVTSLYHLDNPVIRNRLRDGGIFRKGGYLKGSRSFNGIEVASIGRLDDVKKVKGINLYPQAVDDLVFSMSEVEQYEVVITSTPSFSDEIALRVQLKSEYPENSFSPLKNRLTAAIKERMGINFKVELANEIPVNEYKARRWKDLRVRT